MARSMAAGGLFSAGVSGNAGNWLTHEPFRLSNRSPGGKTQNLRLPNLHAVSFTSSTALKKYESSQAESIFAI